MNTVKRINEIIKTRNSFDFILNEKGADKLILTGSFDFSYYHDIELIFHGVSYHSLADNFYAPNFRKATNLEVSELKKTTAIATKQTAYCIQAETHDHLQKQCFYIVADSVTINEGRVYYYHRKNLKPEESIASWAKTNNDNTANKRLYYSILALVVFIIALSLFFFLY